MQASKEFGKKVRTDVELEEGSPDEEAQPRKLVDIQDASLIRQPSFSDSGDEGMAGARIDTL